MATINLVILAIALMIMAYVFRRPALALADSVVWLLFGIYSLSLSAATWDIYYGLFAVGVGLFFVALIEGLILRPRKNQTEPEEEFWESEAEDYAKRREEMRQRIELIVGRRSPNRLDAEDRRLIARAKNTDDKWEK